MDIATLNWLGITLLAAFGLWAFWKGGQSVQKRQQRDREQKEDRH